MIKNLKFFNYFCPLCWRPTTENERFCLTHRQPNGAKEYKKRRRQLERAAFLNGWSHPTNDIFNSLISKVIAPKSVNRSITESSINRADDDSLLRISTICASNYQECFRLISAVNTKRFKSIDEWGGAVIRVIDKSANEATINDWKINCSECTPSNKRLLLLHLFARIETEKTALPAPAKKGPPIGTISLNQEVIIDLLKAYDDQQQLKTKINLAALARRHGLTKQTIHKKWIMLLKNPEVYRKAIKKQKTQRKKQ